MTTIKTFPMRSPVVSEFASEIRALVSYYVGRLSVAETIGALEVVKLEIFEEARDIAKEQL